MRGREEIRGRGRREGGGRERARLRAHKVEGLVLVRCDEDRDGDVILRGRGTRGRTARSSPRCEEAGGSVPRLTLRNDGREEGITLSFCVLALNSLQNAMMFSPACCRIVLHVSDAASSVGVRAPLASLQ